MPAPEHGRIDVDAHRAGRTTSGPTRVVRIHVGAGAASSRGRRQPPRPRALPVAQPSAAPCPARCRGASRSGRTCLTDRANSIGAAGRRPRRVARQPARIPGAGRTRHHRPRPAANPVQPDPGCQPARHQCPPVALPDAEAGHQRAGRLTAGLQPGGGPAARSFPHGFFKVSSRLPRTPRPYGDSRKSRLARDKTENFGHLFACLYRKRGTTISLISTPGTRYSGSD